MVTPILRMYRDEDFSQVVEIALDLLVEDKERVEGVIRLASRDDHYELFVAEADGKVAGFLLLNLVGWDSSRARVAEIYWIAVRSEWQRKGFGSALIKNMEQYAKERQIRKVFVETGTDNKITMHFYIENGYKPEAVRKDYFKEGEESVILGKYL